MNGVVKIVFVHFYKLKPNGPMGSTVTAISTRGRVTQASLTSLLSSKRIPDCRIAFLFVKYEIRRICCD